MGPGRTLFRQSVPAYWRHRRRLADELHFQREHGSTYQHRCRKHAVCQGVPDIVAPFESEGAVQWDGAFGNFFGGNTLSRVADPQCAGVASDLRQYCTIQAVTDAKTGQIFFRIRCRVREEHSARRP